MDYFGVVLGGSEQVPLAYEGQLHLLSEAAGVQLQLPLELAPVLELVSYLCPYLFSFWTVLTCGCVSLLASCLFCSS